MVFIIYNVRYHSTSSVCAMSGSSERILELQRVRNDTLVPVSGVSHFLRVDLKSSVDQPPFVKHRMTRSKYWSLVIFLVLAIFLWVTVGGKLAVDGAYTYSQYFTNWMWTFNTIFYTLYVLSLLECSGHMYHFIISFVCWPFVSNVAQVFILVAVLKVSGTKLYEDAAGEVGWGLTLFWDQLVHMFPLVWALIWLMFSWTDVRNVINEYRWVPGERRFLIMYIAYNFVAANLFVFMYWSVNDIYDVYGVDVNPGAAVFLIELIYIAFNFVPLVILSPISNTAKKYKAKPSSVHLVVDDSVV
jgi:hypothetical protein